MTTTLDYFAVLGVSQEVGQEDLETRYNDLTEYLSSPDIPPHLQEWAERQLALVDEAYAVLGDAELRSAARKDVAEAVAEPEDEDEFEEDVEEVRPKKAVRQSRARRQTPEPAGIADFIQNLGSQPVLLGIIAGVLVVGGVLFGRFGLGGDDGGDSQSQQQEQAQDGVPLDAERIATLMEMNDETPGDPQILFELGETFFQANEWEASLQWFNRLLEVDPDNVHAMTDVGTCYFNLGQPDLAEESWLAALEVNPDDVQVHYNLGFLYANSDPADLEAARREWQLAIDLEPDSELADTAQVHLDSLLDEDFATEADPGAEATITPTPVSE